MYKSRNCRSLPLCLKVTQFSTSEIGDAPLYNRCSLPIQVMTIGPLPAPSKWKSGGFNAWGHSSTHRTTHRMATVMVFIVVSSEGHIMPLYIFEVGLKVNTKLYLDVLTSVVIPWYNRVAGGTFSTCVGGVFSMCVCVCVHSWYVTEFIFLKLF